MSICGCLLLTLNPVLNIYFKNTFHIVKVNGEEAGKMEFFKLHRRIKKTLHKEVWVFYANFSRIKICNLFEYLSLLRLEILESMRHNHQVETIA